MADYFLTVFCRAGAVEQLRTHTKRLNSLHPPKENGGVPFVELYEKGYGKDAAGDDELLLFASISILKTLHHAVYFTRDCDGGY